MIEWLALESNRDHTFVFEIALKYCILDSFVDYEGYLISSKGFLPTVVDIAVISIKFTHSSLFSSLLPEMHIFTLTISCLVTSNLPCLCAEYIMRNAGLEEAQAGIKIAGRNINNLRYADDTTLMAKGEEELKSLLMKVKEES